MYCTQCGTANQPGARFCHGCGVLLGAATLPLGAAVQGRYAILGLVGQGGMGAVYQVSDGRLGGKIMALKELSDAAITNPQDKALAAAAFMREAQLLAHLDHPNIPQVTDFFTENVKHYLVMEFVSGETLESRLARQGGPVGEAEARDWALQLCDVLAYLHGHTPPIIFRDLKPANIMITPQGQIKLIDFGIARLFSPGKAGDTLVLGTPGYAPPEQYGKGQTDARSDIHSLGVVLHTLLTCYDPAMTPFALPPVRQINPTVSLQMEAVIQKATQADPTHRYQSAGQMRMALAGQPVAPTVVKPGNTRRWLWAALAGVLLVICVGGAVIAAALSFVSGSTRQPAPTTAPARAVATDIPVMPTSRALPAATGLPPAATPGPPATRVPATATRVPATATPMPPTPTQAPTAQPPVSGLFSKLWQRHYAALGPPLAGNMSDRSFPAYTFGEMAFEGGHMFSYVGPPRRIWVVYGSKRGAWTGSGAWGRYPETWNEGDPEYSCRQEAEYPRQPKWGFGQVWCKYPEVRAGLRWGLEGARDIERESPGSRVYRLQEFEHGFIFRDSDGWTNSLAYVFFDNGTFVRESYR